MGWVATIKPKKKSALPGPHCRVDRQAGRWAPQAWSRRGKLEDDRAVGWDGHDGEATSARGCRGLSWPKRHRPRALNPRRAPVAADTRGWQSELPLSSPGFSRAFGGSPQRAWRLRRKRGDILCAVRLQPRTCVETGVSKLGKKKLTGTAKVLAGRWWADCHKTWDCHTVSCSL